MNLNPFKNLFSGSALAAQALGITAFLSFAAPSHAVSFSVVYDFTGGASGVSNTPLITGNAITATGALTFINPLIVPPGFSVPLRSATGFGTGDFLSFTLTPIGPLTTIDLNTFTFRASNTSILGISTSLTSISLRSSLDSFVNDIGTPQILTNTASPGSFNVSGIAFNNITAPITFRIRANNGNTTTGRLNIDDIAVAGGVAVPYEFETVAGVLLFGVYFIGKRYLKAKIKSKV